MSHLIDVVKRIDQNLVKKLSRFERNFSGICDQRIIRKIMIRKDTQGRESFSSDQMINISGFIAGRKGSNCAIRDRLETSFRSGKQRPPDRAIMAP